MAHGDTSYNRFMQSACPPHLQVMCTVAKHQVGPSCDQVTAQLLNLRVGLPLPEGEEGGGGGATIA